MQLTQKQEADVLQAYQKYFDSYMKGDIETVAGLLDDEYSQIGSAETEVFFNKKDAVQFLHDTIDQVAGKIEMRNRVIKTERQDNIFSIHEFADLYARAGNEWIFYARFRASTFMQYKNEAWKIIHQHSSFPDARADAGENIAVDKVAEENQLLREAVKRRTIELEQKNRELELEASLEKVRSRTMAMQKSEELPEAANNLFGQMQALGIPAWSAGYCIWDDDKKAATACMSSEGVLQKPFKIPTTGDPSFVNFYDAYKRGEKLYVEELGGEALVSHYKYMRALPVVGEALDEIINAGFPLPTFQIFHVAYFSHGYLLFITYEPVPVMWNVFKRFAKVFEQTYTRFLDLQKAEAQAKEAKIEAALERIRSRTMGMQKSDELKDIIQVLYDQFVQLKISIEHTGFIMDYHSGDEMRIWLADHLEVPSFITIPYFDSPHWNSFIEARKNGKDFFINTLNKEEKDKFYRELFTFIPEISDEVKENYFHYPGLAISTVLLENVGLYIENFSGFPFTDEENKTLMRFGKVFQQTYTRFLDLQKAEAQTREANIEAGLERVRARAMAMQKSDELAELVNTIFKELTKLHFLLNRCIIMIYDHNTKDSVWWLANPESETVPVGVSVNYHEYPPYLAYVDAWQNRTMKWQYILEGTEKKEWDDYIFSETGMSTLPPPVKEGMKSLRSINLNASFNNFGSLTAASVEPMPDEQFDILLRFAKVFDLTYTRFNDLQKAEANATEAKIEASLERVRSKAMSMHSSRDLADTIGVFYHELELFSITPRRCGVGLLHKESKMAELSTMNTTSGGSHVEIIGTIKMEGHPVLESVYNNWLLQKEYHPVLKGTEIKEYYQLLRPQIAFPEYPNDAIQFGYFFFFDEGGVYAWTDKELGEEELKIYRRFTSVLSLTYKRYQDLKIAEAHAEQSELDLIQLKEEKQRTEEALSELKETQKQLIQSEKMASLGELTAGIAHEIQNPLNFVNNFSEVSNELIVEMNEELLKGDIEEAKLIAGDILQNLEKINHHGKRAAAIVKGMLQHSRTSSGTKEPTDINKLVDEYLRLAYHGLRAKDKTFNATIQTAYDESISNINIIPQDVGRVILNLITNAFYIVGEKKQQQLDAYDPTVSVSTKKINERVEIIVSDNGNGIPEKILDKIFQPFFTTKPTGQGTGLGLSLAYDIVKAHGGELKVQTKEGEGTEFIVQLPV